MGELLEPLAVAAADHRVPGRPWFACHVCHAPMPFGAVPLLRSAPTRVCGRCGGVPPHPWRPLITALLTSVAYSLTAARFGWSLPLFAYLCFFSGLMALSVADLEGRVLPVSILYPTFALTAVLLLAASLVEGRLSSFAAAGVWSALLALGMWFVWRLGLRDAHGRSVRRIDPTARYEQRFGFGDVRLSALVAFGVVWVTPPAKAALAAALAFLLAAAAFGVTFVVRSLATGQWRARLPFGPFLAFGAFSTLAWGSLTLSGARL